MKELRPSILVRPVKHFGSVRIPILDELRSKLSKPYSKVSSIGILMKFEYPYSSFGAFRLELDAFCFLHRVRAPFEYPKRMRV